MSEENKEAPLPPRVKENPVRTFIPHEGSIPTERINPDTLEPERVRVDETIPSTDPETDPALMALRAERDKTLNNIVNSLHPKLRDVITLRFGLGGNPELSVAETAKLLGASEDSVRRWEHKAKNAIRKHPFYPKHYKIFIGDDDL